MDTSDHEKRVRGPSSDDLAHDMCVAGPLQNLRKALDRRGSPDAPFTEEETAIIFAWLPPRRRWDADRLAELREEIEEFSRDPGSARDFVAERLAFPFASRMRDYVEDFARSLPSWFRRVNAPVPDAERVLVLQAVVLCLHDLSASPAGHSAPVPESLPPQWQRCAS